MLGTLRDYFECPSQKVCDAVRRLDTFVEAKVISWEDVSEPTALLGASQTPQEANESFNYSGAIIGASVAALGTAAAIIATKHCNKKDNDFERQ